MTTSDLHAADFSEFFTGLWDKRPFCWQKKLAKRVLEHDGTGSNPPGGAVPSGAAETTAPSWPDAIALPTASGKTACMDIALFALAAQASRLDSGPPITAPRRIFFVVDRRVIVDEAYERACRLAEKLAQAKDGIVKSVADALRRIAHGGPTGFEDERPLAVHALRGGMYRSEAWARNPLQPTIVASTVDQIGSRLLFRAYGRGSTTWPIYAGLAANDNLVLLDEAHCAQPFLQTLQADQARPKRGTEPDPVYGEALTNTWKWLDAHKNEDGAVDFGIVHLDRLLAEEATLADLNAPSATAPIMLPAHVDCWAQTAPEPRPSPEVSHFLHGPREGTPDVQVCWRADLDLTGVDGPNHAVESLMLCPPASSETLPVPVGVFRCWLARVEPMDDSGDVEGVEADDEREEDSKLVGRRIVRWHGGSTTREDITSDPGRIRPGDVIVIPTMHPGAWNRLGGLPSEALETPAALDVGDPAHRLTRAKPILRLHPALVDVWPDSLAAKAAARSLLDGLEQRYEDDSHEVADAALALLTMLSEADPLPERWTWLPEAAKELRAEFSTVAGLRRQHRLARFPGCGVAGHRDTNQTTSGVCRREGRRRRGRGQAGLRTRRRDRSDRRAHADRHGERRRCTRTGQRPRI